MERRFVHEDVERNLDAVVGHDEIASSQPANGNTIAGHRDVQPDNFDAAPKERPCGLLDLHSREAGE